MTDKHYAVSNYPINGKYQVMVSGGSMSKAEAQAAANAKNAEIEQKDNMPVKDIVFNVDFQDGEYLSGYTIFGESAEELENLGMARYVSGWGYHVRDEVVKALGTSFTHAQAVEYTRPYRMEKARIEQLEKENLQAKFDHAARTGRPVVINQYTDDCNDPREECSMDNVTVYAMPDGSTKTSRSHTW